MSEMSSKAKKLFDEFNYSQTVYHAYSASGTDNEYIEMKRKTRDAKRESFEEYVVGLESRITELEAEVTKCHELQDAYCDRIAELEDWAYNNFETNNGKDSPNDTQSSTIVYGKEREE